MPTHASTVARRSSAKQDHGYLVQVVVSSTSGRNPCSGAKPENLEPPLRTDPQGSNGIILVAHDQLASVDRLPSPGMRRAAGQGRGRTLTQFYWLPSRCGAQLRAGAVFRRAVPPTQVRSGYWRWHQLGQTDGNIGCWALATYSVHSGYRRGLARFQYESCATCSRGQVCARFSWIPWYFGCEYS